MFGRVSPNGGLAYNAHTMTEALVSTEWLAARLGAPGVPVPPVRVIEASMAPETYTGGHLAGAVAIDWKRELIEREDESSGLVVDAERFASMARRLGLRPDDTLVFYGDQGGRHATRALWTFEYYGHAGALHWLDGGREKWLAEGRPLTQDEPSLTPSDYPTPAGGDASVRLTCAEVQSRLGQDGFAVLDVRTDGEHAGTDVRAARGGRIPGALHVFWKQSVAADGRLRPRPELEELYGVVPRDGEVATHCQLGVRSAHTWFVLRHVLGYTNVRNYDGSWREWGDREDTPIEAVG